MKNIVYSIKLLSLYFILSGISYQACSQAPSDKLRNALLDKNTKTVFVVSHRGDWRNAPENSLQAIQNCIDMGVDIVEIDLKKTRDGHLVLMHDKTIDRTTTGKGAPSDYTLEELRQFRLRNGAGHKTAHLIPTLEEAMMLIKGKILVNIDKGYDYYKDVVKVLASTGTLSQCIIKAGLPYEQVKAENGDVLDKMIFMPIIDLGKDNASQMIADYLTHMNPVAFELVFREETPAVKTLFREAGKNGAKLFVNSLWPELCGGHDDDRAVEQGQPDQAWGWMLDQGVHIIQTDRPEDLLGYLRQKGFHQ